MLFYPIELNLQGRTALVVGLGAVGRRKAAGLAEAGARVVGIDPEPRRDAEEDLVSRGIVIRRESYREGHLDGVVLVLASATDVVNRQVVIDSKGRGIWVCSASDPEDGDFTVPASWRSGPLCVTVSTSGASPALAAAMRDRAAAAIGQTAAELAVLLAELRPEVKRCVTDPATRRRIFAGWGDPRWLELLASDGAAATLDALRREFEAIGKLAGS